MPKQLLNETRKSMNLTIEAYQRELGGIRAGVANASILDRVQVMYYGVPTPLNQLASISVPEARMLVVSPYDANSLGDVEKAILQSDLGLTPNNDGKVIRLVIPALTKERRQELVRVVGKEQENAKVSIRNQRRDANDAAKKLEKDNQINEDGRRALEDDIQKLTDEMIKEIDKLTEEKEDEILNN